MLQVVDDTVFRKLAFNCQPGPPVPISFWAAALNHKARNDAMKGQPVIKTGVDQF
jgi:hypothetical protein